MQWEVVQVILRGKLFIIWIYLTSWRRRMIQQVQIESEADWGANSELTVDVEFGATYLLNYSTRDGQPESWTQRHDVIIFQIQICIYYLFHARNEVWGIFNDWWLECPKKFAHFLHFLRLHPNASIRYCESDAVYANKLIRACWTYITIAFSISLSGFSLEGELLFLSSRLMLSTFSLIFPE